MTKLNLEFMCNKGKYKKYLSSISLDNEEEKATEERKTEKYKKQILKLTSELIHVNEFNTGEDFVFEDIPKEILDAFEEYRKECVYFFERKENRVLQKESCLKKPKKTYYDEDTLFPEEGMIDPVPTNSLWGNHIFKKP